MPNRLTETPSGSEGAPRCRLLEALCFHYLLKPPATIFPNLKCLLLQNHVEVEEFLGLGKQ